MARPSTPTPTTRATRRTTTASTYFPTSTVSTRDALVNSVMSMDPPELRDALMDPMMMAIGNQSTFWAGHKCGVINQARCSPCPGPTWPSASRRWRQPILWPSPSEAWGGNGKRNKSRLAERGSQWPLYKLECQFLLWEDYEAWNKLNLERFCVCK